MSRNMTLHEDVLERILNILKQDDYYRTLEDLPVINELTAYDDIKLFPELYDTSTIIERVTTEADLIERQLRRPGMYPQHTDFSQPTSILPKTTPNSQSTLTNIAEILHLRVHYPVDREHRLHRPVLQMRHPHKHHPRHLQYHINHNSLQKHNTPHQARTNNIHLRKQILTSFLSLPLQEKINNVYQNLQMVLG